MGGEIRLPGERTTSCNGHKSKITLGGEEANNIHRFSRLAGGGVPVPNLPLHDNDSIAFLDITLENFAGAHILQRAVYRRN